jgi:CheY-like chemotaxis protein
VHSVVPPRLERMKRVILVAEDDEFLRAAYRHTLENRGYCVLSAADGLEAVAHAQALVPDLILSDLQMPRLDGFAVLEKLKLALPTKPIPVIMMTARDDAEACARALDLGCAAFLVKPISPSTLLTAISRALDRPVACRS